MYGHLLVKEATDQRRGGQVVWLCWCACGEEAFVTGYLLKSGKTKSCGCHRREMGVARGKASRRHGEGSNGKETPEYRCWNSMKARCYIPSHTSFKNYGGRGITVCKRWRASYEAFLADMGRKPSSDHSIDRIDNDGPYSSKNCRWSTWEEQNNNRREPKRRYPLIEIEGRAQSIIDWQAELGVCRTTYHRRRARGLSPAEALLLG